MSNSETIAVYGAGGFAREVASMLPQTEFADHRLLGFIDDNAGANAELHALPVMSLDALQAEYPDTLVVLAIAHSATRQTLAGRVAERGFRVATPVHHSAMMSARVVIGEGSIICQGVIMTVDITLDAHVHVNLGCTLGHDVVIGAYSTLAPGVNVSGNVTIGSRVWVATGACIINGTSEKPLTIGDGSVIAAGACVTGDVQPHALYAGVPASFKKHLSSTPQ